MQTQRTIFYSESTIIDTIKNGGWTSIIPLTFLFFLLSFFPGLVWTHFKPNWINISFIIIAILFLLSQFIFGTEKIKIENDKILLKNSFSSNWKELKIEDISHICFFISPVESHFSFPKAVIYPLINKKGTTIEFKINKKDIYRFLSILQDYGKDVLIFEKLRNINETEFYTPNANLEIVKFNDSKYYIDFESHDYKSSIPINSKRVSKIIYLTIIITIIKLILTYGKLNETRFFINIMIITFSFGIAIICEKGGLNWIKWIVLIMAFFFSIELMVEITNTTSTKLLYLLVSFQIVLMVVSFILLLKTKTKNSSSS